jgi:hypothetical protein
MIRVPADLLDNVRIYRHANMLGTESEAFRRLIAAGLEAQSKPTEAQAA